MTEHKYIQLARDISRFCDTQNWATFMTADIRAFINTRRGFYSYSNGTFNRAIELLVQRDEVIVHRANMHVARIFVYVPVIRSKSFAFIEEEN